MTKTIHYLGNIIATLPKIQISFYLFVEFLLLGKEKFSIHKYKQKYQPVTKKNSVGKKYIRLTSRKQFSFSSQAFGAPFGRLHLALRHYMTLHHSQGQKRQIGTEHVFELEI